MRVAIDATPLTVPTGGTRRYVVELTRALAKKFPNDKIHLFSDQPLWETPSELIGLRNVKLKSFHSGKWADKWWSLGLPWELYRNQIDIFHGADFSIPYLPLTASVLVIHDLSPWKKKFQNFQLAKRTRERTPYLLKLATQITTHSEAIRDELSDCFGVSLSKITAIPLAAARVFDYQKSSNVAQLLERLGISRPYLLFVGDRKKRKNLQGLIDAWHELRRYKPEVSLVLVGNPSVTEIENLREPGLHIIGPLNDKAIKSLLSKALALVYPSLYEGFGLPVLEAMSVGAPVITSKDPAISEVAGGAALQVDVASRQKLTQALVEVATSAQLRTFLEERGRRRVSQFTWRSTAVRTHAVYEKAIRLF